jgi:hypothetical protein
VLGTLRLREAAKLLPQPQPPHLPRPRPGSAAPERAGELEGLASAALAGQAGLVSSARLRQAILALVAEASYRAAGWALTSGTRTGAADQGPPGLSTGAVLSPIDFYTLRRELEALAGRPRG